MLSPPTSMRTLYVRTVDDVDVLVTPRLVDQRPTEFADTDVRGDETDSVVNGIHHPSTMQVWHHSLIFRTRAKRSTSDCSTV